MTDSVRSRYISQFLSVIANEVRAGLREIPDNFEGIHAVSAALDAFEHEVLIDPRSVRSTNAMNYLQAMCLRFCPASVYQEVLDSAYSALRRAPETEGEAVERQRVRDQYMAEMRAVSGDAQAWCRLPSSDETASATSHAQDGFRVTHEMWNTWCSRDAEAEQRGMELLRENLSEAQRDQFDQHGWFTVTGSHSKKTYRIRKARQLNIDELDKRGNPVLLWCFVPTTGVVTGDCMLAQKLALETDEKAALKVANKFAPYGGNSHEDRIAMRYAMQGLTTPDEYVPPASAAPSYTEAAVWGLFAVAAWAMFWLP